MKTKRVKSLHCTCGLTRAGTRAQILSHMSRVIKALFLLMKTIQGEFTAHADSRVAYNTLIGERIAGGSGCQYALVKALTISGMLFFPLFVRCRC